MGMSRRSFLAATCALATGAVASAAEIQDEWERVARIVAIGDVHGDKDALVAVLKMAGMIDAENRWTGGQAHLVQIGDVPARWPQTRQAFDLLMKLETQAAAAGGKVHAIIGNHDAGVIHGDLRNILPEEFGEFRESGSEKRLANAFEEEMAARRRAGRLPSKPSEIDYLKSSWFERHPPGFVEHREAFSPSGPYGSWIRRNNAVIRINDVMFLHGGISPRYARKTRREMNAAIRRELADPERLLPGTTTDTQGPLWYRGLAEGDPGPIESHLQEVLRFHGVRRIVIGHTVTRTAILPRFESRVVNIDLGLSRFYGRPPAFLLIEKDSTHVIHRGTKIPLPESGRNPLVEYLSAVEAADPQPSPVRVLLERLTQEL
jgi:Calcineurin-like phosphoesterase